MSQLTRFGVSIEDELLAKFDELIAGRGYENRSEALRDLIRKALVEAQVDKTKNDVEVVGSLTFVYDHHAHDLMQQMAEVQHDHHDLVVSVIHVHIDHHNCLETAMLRGKASRVRALADSILKLKGVKHGNLFITLPADAIEGRRRASQEHHHPAVEP